MNPIFYLCAAAAVATPLTALAGGTSTMAPKSDIVDTAVAAGSFKTLATALEAAGLVDTLKGAGPFTVFAPTDAAFAKLQAEPGWRVYEVPCGHDVMVDMPERLTEILLEAAPA